MEGIKAIRVEIILLANGDVTTQDLCEYIKDDLEENTESILAVRVRLIEEKNTSKKNNDATA